MISLLAYPVSTTTQEAARDTKLLLKLLKTLHIPTIDSFFKNAVYGVVDCDVLHFFENFEAVVTASSFYFYDKKLYDFAFSFHTSISESLDIGAKYTSPGRGNLHRFVNNNEPDFEEAISNFYLLVGTAQNTFKQLLEYVQKEYFEVDIEETSKIAFLERQAFEKKLRDQGLTD